MPEGPGQVAATCEAGKEAGVVGTSGDLLTGQMLPEDIRVDVAPAVAALSEDLPRQAPSRIVNIMRKRLSMDAEGFGESSNL